LKTHIDGPVCTGCDKKLEQCHPDLKSWFHKVKAKYINVHVSYGWRGPDEQQTLHDQGKSDVVWPDSKHNVTLLDGTPISHAIDIFQIDEDGSARFSLPFYKLVASQIDPKEDRVRWGIVLKSGSVDGPHFQLI
jgi:hypothetical protein